MLEYLVSILSSCIYFPTSVCFTKPLLTIISVTIITITIISVTIITITIISVTIIIQPYIYTCFRVTL